MDGFLVRGPRSCSCGGLAAVDIPSHSPPASFQQTTSEGVDAPVSYLLVSFHQRFLCFLIAKSRPLTRKECASLSLTDFAGGGGFDASRRP